MREDLGPAVATVLVRLTDRIGPISVRFTKPYATALIALNLPFLLSCRRCSQTLSAIPARRLLPKKPQSGSTTSPHIDGSSEALCRRSSVTCTRKAGLGFWKSMSGKRPSTTSHGFSPLLSLHTLPLPMRPSGSPKTQVTSYLYSRRASPEPCSPVS